ncbi:MAG: hypothetical protein IT377_23990 [Polyangiaceae bacterium]|nr:hypothetical protein [Polyangiaceae bacterium]
MKTPVVLGLSVAGLLALSCQSKPAEGEAPKPKSKEEFLKVLDKHRDDYMRCEKLRVEAAAVPPRPAPSTPAAEPDAGKPDAGKPDAGKPDAGKPDAGKPDAGKPDAPPAPSAPPVPTAAIEYQKCTVEYWKKVKQEMGPFDQAKADEWYVEWRKGVKVE